MFWHLKKLVMQRMFLLFSNKDLGITSYKIGKKGSTHHAGKLFIKKSHHLVFKPIYKNLVTIRKCRIALTILRVSSHRLQIEAGRWSKPHSTLRNERLCSICNKLEDEFHLLFECTLYNKLRQELIKPFHHVNTPNNNRM